MYRLADLEFEPTEYISAQQQDDILTRYSQLWLAKSQYIQVADLTHFLKDEWYYVGTDYFVIKGKASFYKGVIVVARKEKLIAYLIRIIQLNDVRSVFIIPQQHQNMLVRLDDEGSLILSIAEDGSIR